MINFTPYMTKPALNFAGKGKITYFDENQNKLTNDSEAACIEIEKGNDEIPDKIGGNDVHVLMSGGETDTIIGDQVIVTGDAKVNDVQSKALYAFKTAVVANKATSQSIQMHNKSTIKDLETTFLTTFNEAKITGNALVNHQADLHNNSSVKNITADHLVMWDSSEVTDAAKVNVGMQMFAKSKATNVVAKSFNDRRNKAVRVAHPVKLEIIG